MAAELAGGETGVPAIADRSIDDLDLEIRRLARLLSAETYQMLVLVRDFDDRFGFARWGLRSCAEWLAWSCGLSLSAAREKVRTAQALRGLPAIAAAFADGRLTYTKVRALTRVAHESDEDLLLAYALEASAAQVEERCRQLRNAEPESVDVARRVWERRSLTMFRDPARGCMRISIELPIEDGELVGRAIESAVAAGDAAFGAEFGSNPERSADAWRAQQADALVAIVKAHLGGGAKSADEKSIPIADHYQVVVHVDERSLRGGAGRSDLPIETVNRLTCDGSLITIVEDEHGMPLDVGRKRRTVTTALKRALWSRDRGCSFPGCRNTRYVHGHHIEHWANGGETSLANLTLLCTYHHTLVHEGGFTIHHDGREGIYFRRSDGRVIPRSGYRAADMLDDVAVPLPGEKPSAEVRMAAIVHGYELDDEPWRVSVEGLVDGSAIPSDSSGDPSAEGFATRVGSRNSSSGVCEARGLYRVGFSVASAGHGH
ncbi:MAG TPA: DUF222 domain-containing protein [Gammaproteobacteria bacterium]|nr:DUF222 domain-containing protein [Gammaproteobacteria bacterium]